MIMIQYILCCFLLCIASKVTSIDTNSDRIVPTSKSNLHSKLYYPSSSSTCTRANYFPLTIGLSQQKNSAKCESINIPIGKHLVNTNSTKIILGYISSMNPVSPSILELLSIDQLQLSKQSITYCLSSKYTYFVQNLYCYEQFQVDVCRNSPMSLYTPMLLSAREGNMRKHNQIKDEVANDNEHNTIIPSQSSQTQTQQCHVMNSLSLPRTPFLTSLWNQIKQNHMSTMLLQGTSAAHLLHPEESIHSSRSKEESRGMILFNPLFQEAIAVAAEVAPTSRPTSKPTACTDEPTSRPSSVPTLATTHVPTHQPTLTVTGKHFVSIVCGLHN
jgi:hypothetical protein